MRSTITQKTRKTLTFNNDGVEEVRAGAKALVNAGALAHDRRQTKDLSVEIILLLWGRVSGSKVQMRPVEDVCCMCRSCCINGSEDRKY